jgi:signal transduction histidine kinase
MDRTERTRRPQWARDAVLVAFAVLMWLATVRYRANVPPAVPPWVLHLDQAAGALGCLALCWRRRIPVVLAAVLIALSTFSETVTGAVVVALFTVAVHRPARSAAALLAAALVAFACYEVLRPELGVPLALVAALVVVMCGAAVGWGMAVRSRRELIASLRDRADAAEVEARLRAERAQHEARETIAREMHDVLGHRLSLLSVHAGALVYNRDAAPEDVLRAAEVIRENSHRALQDLREVIGVLRAPTGELPLPGVADIVELVEETRQAGTPVTLRDDAGVTTTDREVPATAGRSLYRFVQEGLTNVRKHAPGAATHVRIDGGPGAGLTAEVVNDRPAAPSGPRAGSGEGLRGLAERAALIGGGIEHGPTGAGGWRIGMWLPWPR